MSENKLKIVFAGTPDFAAGHLQALIDNQFDVIAVYSQPDRKKGRGKKLQPSAVKEVALAANIAVYQPLNFKNAEDIEELKQLNADVMVVVAYGLLLPESVLTTPEYGCINVHGSLLPRWRGAAPIERCIEAGDRETGITIMQMDKGLDTGDMLNITRTPITAETNGDSLRATLLPQGCKALIETLNAIDKQQLNPVKQDDSLANYAHKLSRADAVVDWSQTAVTINQKIRAFNSSNVCYSQLGEHTVKIWQAQVIDNHEGGNNTQPGEIIALTKKSIDVACGEGVLRLQQLQLPNSKKMDVASVLNGRKDLFNIGNIFTHGQ